MPKTVVIDELDELNMRPSFQGTRITDHVFWPWVKPSHAVIDQCWGCGKVLAKDGPDAHVHMRAGMTDHVESAALWLYIAGRRSSVRRDS